MAEVDMKFDPNSSLNLPSNSDKSKSEHKKEEKKIQKVVTGNVTVKKKGFFKKFKNSMISEDANSVGGYVVSDIVIPMVKDLVYNSIRGALDMILWGGSSVGKRGRKNVPYNSLNDGGTYHYNGSSNSSNNVSHNKQKMNDYYNISEVMFDTRRDAEAVLETLRMVLEEFPSVSVAEFYDTLGQTAPHTTYKYGWTSLIDADVRSCRDGYYIDCPAPKLIN